MAYFSRIARVAELGNWMVAERVRWLQDAAFIVLAVNAHDDLVATLQMVADSSAWNELGVTEQNDIRAALAKSNATLADK